MDDESTISEKSKVSIALIVAVIVPVLWFFASDHNAVASLSHDRDELRQDVKEIKATVNTILVQMASTRRSSMDPANYTPPPKNSNGR